MIKRLVAPALPYVATILGLVIWRSAWIALAGYHAGIIIVLWASKSRLSLKRLFETRSYRAVIAPAVGGAAAGLLLYALWPFLSIPPDLAYYVIEIGLTPSTWPFFLAYYILVNPFIEELFWRNYLGSDSNRFVLNDLLFSGYHTFVLAGKIGLFWLIVIFVLLSLSARYWRRIDESNGGLLPSVASHFAADATIIFAIYLKTQP